jgi:hypothetical protein
MYVHHRYECFVFDHPILGDVLIMDRKGTKWEFITFHEGIGITLIERKGHARYSKLFHPAVNRF